MAHRISNLCTVVAWIWSFASMVVCWFGRDLILTIYTKNEQIAEIIHQAWPTLMVFILFDCIQAVTKVNISGLGIINRVVWVTAFDYWVIGIPISYYAMFSINMGIKGLWYGPTLAVFMNYLFYSKEIYFADWQEISDNTT